MVTVSDDLIEPLLKINALFSFIKILEISPLQFRVVSVSTRNFRVLEKQIYILHV